MSTLYNRIENLCSNSGVTITTMCKDSGASRASLSDLKVGRKQNLSAETLDKIANYFDTTIDYLLGRTDDFENSDRFGLDISDEEMHCIEQEEDFPKSTIYERIEQLCDAHGITGGKMCNDLGISRSTMTELRKGRVTTLKLEKAGKIAEYFGVSVDYLLGAEQKETPSSQTAGGASYSDDPDYVELKNMLESIKSGKGPKYAYILGFDGERDFTRVDEEEYQSLKTFLEVHRAMKEKERLKQNPMQE